MKGLITFILFFLPTFTALYFSVLRAFDTPSGTTLLVLFVAHLVVLLFFHLFAKIKNPKVRSRVITLYLFLLVGIVWGVTIWQAVTKFSGILLIVLLVIQLLLITVICYLSLFLLHEIIREIIRQVQLDDETYYAEDSLRDGSEPLKIPSEEGQGDTKEVKCWACGTVQSANQKYCSNCGELL